MHSQTHSKTIRKNKAMERQMWNMSQMPHPLKIHSLLTFFNACYQIQLQKNLMKSFGEKSKKWTLGLKMPQSSHFEHNKKIPLKSKTGTSWLITNTCRQLQYLKNLNDIFRENFKTVDFRPKNNLFTPISDIIRIFVSNHFYTLTNAHSQV